MMNLLDAYKTTRYTVYAPSMVIELSKTCQPLDDILVVHKASEWAFITAWNPRSDVLTDVENHQRHLQLKEMVRDYYTLEGEGIGVNPAWKPERSWLIIGISKERAVGIGRDFEQNAIVYGTLNEPAELLKLFDFD